MHRKVPIVALVVALALLLPVLGGCGRGRDAEPEPTPASIRTPQPTFTPTPLIDPQAAPAALQPIEPIAPIVAADAAPVDSAPELQQPASAVEVAPVVQEQPGFGGPVADVPTPSSPPPLGVINTELVNSRTGPDITFPVVIVLGRGEEYDVTGKSADGTWLRVCCVEEKDAWVSSEFVDVAESMEGVNVAQAGELSAEALTRLNAPPTATPVTVVEISPAPVAQAPAPAAEAAPVAEAAPAAEAAAASAGTASTEVLEVAPDGAATAGHTLVTTERFPESSVVRIFLYVYAGNQALEGYTLRVTRDGVEQSVSESSFGPVAGFTWPIADERQRFQNFKAEFPGVAASGTWTVELVKDGAVVGEAATFTLAEGDGQSELYVRYERN
jgi:hypothetical protein